jgi:hypothetical protein
VGVLGQDERPAAVVSLGLAMHLPPQACISILRKGFCSKLTLTM